jgi:ubiquinone/menaquinone biosynthesis C-methylase UbiE
MQQTGGGLLSRGISLRNAADFDSYYQSPDPWGIGRASRRDRALSRIIGPYVAGKTVLELGCGEGHLTASIFRDAKSSVIISPKMK